MTTLHCLRSSRRTLIPLLWLLWLFLAMPAFAAEEVSVTEAPLEVSHFELNLSTSLRSTQGGFDPYGAYHAYPEGSSAWSLTTNLGASYRFSRVFEGVVLLPFRQSRNIFPTGSQTSTSIGLPLFETKIHLGGWPHLVVHLGVAPPWQYRSSTFEGSPADSISDDPNDGNAGASVHIGAGVSRTFHPLRLAFDVTAILPFTSSQTPDNAPAGTPDTHIHKGNRLQVNEGLSYQFNSRWRLNSGLRQMWSASNSIDDVDALGSRGRLFTTSLGVSYQPNRAWRWMTSFESAYPFYSFAVNQSYAPTVALGMTYVGI
jgi:hypothetical protein